MLPVNTLHRGVRTKYNDISYPLNSEQKLADSYVGLHGHSLHGCRLS